MAASFHDHKCYLYSYFVLAVARVLVLRLSQHYLTSSGLIWMTGHKSERHSVAAGSFVAMYQTHKSEIAVVTVEDSSFEAVVAVKPSTWFVAFVEELEEHLKEKYGNLNF